MTAIGCAEHHVQVVGRGGSPLRTEAAFSGLSYSYVLNGTGQARVALPAEGMAGTLCCEVFDNSDPWRDEVAIYRDNDLAFAGPLLTVKASTEGGDLEANDVSYWMEQRFLPDLHADGDSGDVFRFIFEAAYNLDTSPNIDLTTRLSGIQTSMDFQASEFHRAADALRDLATYGVDWTTVGRRVIAGGKEVSLDQTPLLLHDDGVISAEVTKEGASLATDVAIFGATLKQGAEPVNGRADTNTELYGLIQRSFTQLLVRDNIAADAAALARLESMQPSPLRLRVTLSQETGFDFSDLIPGKRMDVRLSSSTCIEIAEVMRLLQVDVNAEPGSEEVSLQLVPLGETED